MWLTYLLTLTTFIPLSTMAVSVMVPLCPTMVLGHDPSSADQIFSLMSLPELRTTTPEGNSRTE